MTWKELGHGLQAVRDGHDLPYRVAEGLIALGYVTPGTSPDFKPALTERGEHWLGTWEGVETASGLLVANSKLDPVALVRDFNDPRD